MARVKTRSRGALWTEEELAVIDAHPELTSPELQSLLPNRTAQAIGNVRARRSPCTKAGSPEELPPVKEPGEYVETLSSYFVAQFDLMEIWLKWNGYSSYRVLCEIRDKAFGHTTILCTAK